MSARPVALPSPGEENEISRRLVLTLATACGMAVANLYYAQPLLASIAHSFGASTGAAGLVFTLSQIGYAVGLALVVPLGDILERRFLIVAALLCAVVALAAAALAPSIELLGVIGIVVGVTSVVAQILVPFAADLAPAEQRGRVVGTVMSGLLIGILLARTVSGVVAEAFGWRSIFGLAAVLMLGLAGVLWHVLPRRAPNASQSYGTLLTSILTILRQEPLLRRRALYGALDFAAFSAFWTTAAFLLAGPPYHYGTAIIGAFGLLGVAGALMASVAGRLVDRGHQSLASGGFSLLIALSFVLLYVGAQALIALIVGILMLDVGVQGLHITNQSVVYRLRQDARSRITTVYMTSYFTGGALGSAGAVALYGSHGWGGVCLLGAILGTIIVLAWSFDALRSSHR